MTVADNIDSKYTKDLLSKVQLGLDNLGGEFEFDGEKEPSPLSKLYKGTFNKSGDYIEAAYGEKTDSGWVTRGSRSKIHNRTFANNPLAGNGTGPNIVCFEEVGFFANLIDSLGSMKDATYDGTFKFGTIYMFGTGGDMEGGSSEQAREVFYNPASYDCLSFNDIWEESGSIGFFVPYIYRLERFRDEQGIIDQEAATKWSEEKREALRTMCKNLVEQTNVNSKCTIGRKDGHPIHITVGAINTNTSDYVSWIYATYGEDADGSKAWLFDEDYIKACKDCFTQWSVVGYRVNFVHNGSLMNYHSNKPWAARFYDVITEDPYTTDNGVTLATMQFTYK